MPEIPDTEIFDIEILDFIATAGAEWEENNGCSPEVLFMHPRLLDRIMINHYGSPARIMGLTSSSGLGSLGSFLGGVKVFADSNLRENQIIFMSSMMVSSMMVPAVTTINTLDKKSIDRFKKKRLIRVKT